MGEKPLRYLSMPAEARNAMVTQIISLIARKGGVGKTTLAVNLASEMAAEGARVHVLDADPQRSASVWAASGAGFLAGRVTAVSATDEKAFQEAIARLALGNDILVIDTPPGFTEPALLAAAASDLVLLPSGASPLDLAAARDAIVLCRHLQKKNPTGRPAIALIPSRFIPNSGLARELAGSLQQLGERTFPGVAQRVAFAQSAIAGLTIREFAPNSAAQREMQLLTAAVRSYRNEETGSREKR